MTYAGGRLLAGFPADSRPPVFLFSVVTRPVRPHPPRGPEEGAGRLARRLGAEAPDGSVGVLERGGGEASEVLEVFAE